MSQFIEMFDFENNSHNWPMMSFCEFASLDCTMTTDYDYYADYPHIGIDSIEQNTGRLLGYRTVKEDNVKSGKYIFTSKHIIYSKIRPNLNKVATPDFDGLCSADSYPILANEEITSKDFLAYLMRSEVFLRYIVPLSNRTGMPKVNREQVEAFLCPIPPKKEQNKFVSIYHQADKSEFGDSKSQFIEMIKGKQPNGKIRDLVDTNIKSVKKTHDVDDAIEYIDISSIDSVSRSISETTNYVVKSAPSRAQQCVEYGDILVSTVRPINRNIAVVTKESPNLVASTGFCVLRPKEEEYREYLLSVVLTDKYTQKMCDKASGGLYPAINNGDVLSYEVFIPDKEMLTKISTIYHQADKSEYELRSKIDAIDNDIKSFINENMKRIEYRYTLGKNTFIIMDGSICKVNPIFV